MVRFIAYVQGVREIQGTAPWDLFYSFTPQIEVVGSQAAFLDLTGCGALAKLLQRIDPLLAEPWAMGIASTKLLAKAVLMAPRAPSHSVDLAKQLQLSNLRPCTYLLPAQEEAFLATLPVQWLNLSSALQEDLTKLGLFWVADILKLTKQQLIYRLGTDGAIVYQRACGLDRDQVRGNYPPRRITVERNIEEISQREALEEILRACAWELAATLKQREMAATRCQLKLTTETGQCLTAERKLPSPSNEPERLRTLVQTMLGTLSLVEPLNTLELIAPEPVPVVYRQLSLWERPKPNHNRLGKLLSTLQYRFADAKTYLGSQIQLDRYEQMLALHRHD